MALGNDIIDLTVAREQKRALTPRFLDKICTEDEQKYILDSPNPFNTLWLLWSIKESVYKCHLSIEKSRLFNPTKIVCKPQTSNIFQATIACSTYRSISLIKKNVIHTTAQPNGHFPRVYYLRNKGTLGEMKKLIYQKLIIRISRHFGYKPRQLNIVKNELGIPHIYKNSQRLPVNISISHHGDIGAFVYNVF